MLYGFVFLVFCFHFYVTEDAMQFQIKTLNSQLDAVSIVQNDTLNHAWQNSRSDVMKRRFGI